MMSKLIAKLHQNIVNAKMQKVIRIMQELYTDVSERAAAYIAYGAGEEEKAAFAQGEVVDSIVIQTDDEEGYIISTMYKSELLESS